MKFVSILGLVIILFIAFLLCENKKKINFKALMWGLVLQLAFALFILKTTFGKWIFEFINKLAVKLLNFTTAGASFIFGNLVTDTKSFGFIFAFQVLPTIIFFASLMGVLYYLGIMQWIVRIFAIAMIKLMKTSGIESLNAAANIFIGQTEAPLLVKPYVSKSTRSELLAIMVAGMATIAGGVMIAYVAMLNDYVPDIAGHLMAASVINAIGALIFTRLIIPETEEPETLGKVKLDVPKTDANVIDAAANGAFTGLHLALNVGAMLLAFIALIAMCNYGLHLVGMGINKIFSTNLNLSLQLIFGYIFSPFAWIIGIPWKDCIPVGNVLGMKLIINEFFAYSEFSMMLKNSVSKFDARSLILASYALCGFANFSSIAIQIGGIGGIAPSRKHDLAKLGIKALIAATLTNLATAAIAGILI
ncbi:MAG: nucleoside transporter C-terminal domain-containing protein [Armatimonadota bacterium]